MFVIYVSLCILAYVVVLTWFTILLDTYTIQRHALPLGVIFQNCPKMESAYWKLDTSSKTMH